MKKKEKPRVGRPPKPESERAVVVSTKVPPAVRDYLVRLGGGKLTAGLRRVAVDAFERDSVHPLEGIPEKVATVIDNR